MWSKLVKMTVLVQTPRRYLTAAVAAAALSGLGLVAAAPSSAGTALNGTFTIKAGSCSGGVHGSYFRMIMHSGTAKNGPFMSNSDSKCSKKTYTLLAPGSDGGLKSGRYQKQASPAFDSSGNALSHRITKPTRFYGVDFGTATNKVDPQTGKQVSAPQISLSGTSLSGDVRAFGVSWNKQQFNQGSPKPSGTRPGNTSRVTGTYNATTGKYTLQWTSQIQGGPFDGFTGLWHLTGTFKPATTLTAASQPAAAPSSSTAPAASGGSSAHRPHKAAAKPDALPRNNATAAAPGNAPSIAPSVPGTSAATSSDATAAHDTGSARWPWVVVAVAAITGVGALAVRAARDGRTGWARPGRTA